MGVPSRVYVGVLVLALMATLLVVPFTILILSGYQPPPQAPYEVFFPDPQEPATAPKAFLVVASLTCLVLTLWAWRNLLAAARRDRRIRELKSQGSWPPPGPSGVETVKKPVNPPEKGPPPGYQ